MGLSMSLPSVLFEIWKDTLLTSSDKLLGILCVVLLLKCIDINLPI